MPLSNPDGTLITCTGIVSAITGIVVTILKTKPSKTVMDPIPPDALELVRKLTESHHAVQLDIKGMALNLAHLQESVQALSKRAEADHMMIKLLRETMIAWGRLDAIKTAPLKAGGESE